MKREEREREKKRERGESARMRLREVYREKQRKGKLLKINNVKTTSHLPPEISYFQRPIII